MTSSLESRFLVAAPSITQYSHLRPPSHRCQHLSPILDHGGQSIVVKRRPIICSSLSLVQEVSEKEEGDLEELIREIGDELASSEKGNVKSFVECLMLVDLIQRLGIQRYFKQQISRILKTAYMIWDGDHGLGDARASVLAFRLLRLQGYEVFPDVIEKLKDDNGDFTCFSIEKPSEVQGMLNLYKCSQIGFPFETKIMGEAMEYAISHLSRALLDKDQTMLQTENLRFNVKSALDYPRKYLLPRLEARSIIREFSPTSLWERKCLSLSKLDVETLQEQHKQEMKNINIWWEELGVKDLPFSRGQIHKCFLTISLAIFEQEFSKFRATFTKAACITVLIDDLFDDPASDYDGISRFAEAVKCWDPSELIELHQHKAVFESLYSTMADAAREASEAQGRDLLPFYKTVWEDTIAALFQEAEWKHDDYIPTLDEYLQNAAVSIAPSTCFWTSLFLMGKPITDKLMTRIGLHSRFVYLVGLISRLANDVATYQREAIMGETVSAVSCYIKENPYCTEEEAILALQQMMESACVELEWELFTSHGDVPECCSRAIVSYARISILVYRRADAFSEATDAEFEELCKDYMCGSFV